MIFSAFSRSPSFPIVTTGRSIISVMANLPSVLPRIPSAGHSSPRNSRFEFSAIARKVVIKQLLTAAVKRCSGDQMPGIPFGNSGGVATSIFWLRTGEEISPFLSFKYFKSTWYICESIIVYLNYDLVLLFAFSLRCNLAAAVEAIPCCTAKANKSHNGKPGTSDYSHPLPRNCGLNDHPQSYN